MSENHDKTSNSWLRDIALGGARAAEQSPDSPASANKALAAVEASSAKLSPSAAASDFFPRDTEIDFYRPGSQFIPKDIFSTDQDFDSNLVFGYGVSEALSEFFRKYQPDEGATKAYDANARGLRAYATIESGDDFAQTPLPSLDAVAFNKVLNLDSGDDFNVEDRISLAQLAAPLDPGIGNAVDLGDLSDNPGLLDGLNDDSSDGSGFIELVLSDNSVVNAEVRANSDGTYTLVVQSDEPISAADLALIHTQFNYRIPQLDGSSVDGHFLRQDDDLPLTPPVVIEGPSGTLSSAVTNGNLVAMHGTIDSPTATISVSLDGQDYVAQNQGDGSWVLNLDLALEVVEQDIAIKFVDEAGHDSVSLGRLLVDLVAPQGSVRSLIVDSALPTLTGWVDDPSAQIQLVLDGVSHSAINNGDGSWIFSDWQDTPLSLGENRIVVQFVDQMGNRSQVASVIDYNSAPDAQPDEAITQRGIATPIQVLANDSDADGDALYVSSASAANGQVLVNPDGSLTYLANSNFTGTDQIDYQVGDAAGNISNAVVTVEVQNRDPQASADSALTDNQLRTAVIDVLANDRDGDGDALSVDSVFGALNGTVTINGDGSIAYIANVGFYGNDSFTYMVSDGHGGSASAVVNVTVGDVIGPATVISDLALSADSGSSRTDRVTNIAEQTLSAVLSAPLEEGGTLQISLDGGQNWVDISAGVSGLSVTWDVTLIPGDNEILIKATDASGNDGEIYRPAYHLDLEAPDVTVGILALSNDSGPSDSDFVTNVATQQISAQLSRPLEEGEFVQGSIDGGQTWVVISGITGTDIQWDVNFVSPDGQTVSSSIVIKITDAAGNDGASASQDFSFIPPPQDPQTTFPISLSEDTGFSDLDANTSVATQTITASFSMVVGATDRVWGSIDNGLTWVDVTAFVSTQVGADGDESILQWQSQDLLQISDAQNTIIEVRVDDHAGNVIGRAVLDYEIDQVAPSHVISDLSFSSDSGFQTNDLITNVAGQTLTANVSDAQTGFFERLYVSIDGQEPIYISHTSVVNGVLSWGFTLEPGEHSLALWVEDAAGNRGEITTQGYVYLPAIAPASVVDITAISISVDTGVSDQDSLTNTALQTVSATLENDLAPYQFLRVSVDGGLSWTNFDGASLSNLAFTANNVELISGSHTLLVQVADLAGNIVAEGRHEYILDTTAPTTLVDDIAISLDSGTHANDFVTNEGLQTISANLNVALGDGERLFASIGDGSSWLDVTANVVGTVLTWADVNLSGSGSITLAVVDDAGNFGAATTQPYVIDVLAPDQIISNIQLSDDSGSSDADLLTNVAEQTISASLSAPLNVGEFVEASINGGVDWVLIPTAEGASSISWAGAVLLPGENTIAFRITDAAGNRGAVFSEGYVLDQQAQATITVDDVTADNIVSLAESQQAAITITGTAGGDAVAGDQVRLTVNGEVYLGTVGADSRYSIAVAGSDLAAAGTLLAEVVGQDNAGNPYIGSLTAEFGVDLLPPSVTAGQSFSYVENETAGTVIATVAASDDYGIQSFEFANGSQVTDDGYFAINDSGEISLTELGAVRTTETNDFESGRNAFSLNVVAVDHVNNRSAQQQITLQVQNSTVTIDDMIVTNQGAATFTGTAANPGGELTFTVNGRNYLVTASADDTWTFTLPDADSLSDGSYTATITGPDGGYLFPYATVFERTPTSLEFTVSPFIALSSVILHYQVNGGTWNNVPMTLDNVANDGSYIYNVVALAPSNDVRYWFTYTNSVDGQSTDTNSLGIDRYRMGTGSLTQSFPQDSDSFIVDTVAPAAPTLALDTDTGSSNADRVTSDATMNITLAGDAVSWEYSLDSGENWIEGEGNSFELGANATYSIGQIMARQYDLAGNASVPAVNPAIIQIDGEAPLIIEGQRFSYREGQSIGAIVGNLAALDDGTIVRFSFADGTQFSPDGFYQIDNAGQLSLTAAGAALGAATNDVDAGSNDFSYSVFARDLAGNTSLMTQLNLSVTRSNPDLGEASAETLATFDFVTQVVITDTDGLLLQAVRDQIAPFAHIVVGGDENNSVLGGVGSDAIFGGNGNDHLVGADGRDALRGGDGDDVLSGGAGADVLVGGAGADTFLFAADDHLGIDEIDLSRTDIISDFSLVEGDVLDLSALLQGEDEATLENYLNFSRDGDDTVIAIDVDGDGSGTDWSIRLQGVDLGADINDNQTIISNLLLSNSLYTD